MKLAMIQLPHIDIRLNVFKYQGCDVVRIIKDCDLVSFAIVSDGNYLCEYLDDGNNEIMEVFNKTLQVLETLKEFRRKGYGTKLIKYILKKLPNENINFIIH